MENDEIQSFIKVWSSALAALCYCYYIPSRLRIGLPRLLSIVPVLVLFILLPFHLHSVSFSGSTAFFLTWLANSKLILFSLSHSGPLNDPKISLPLFLSLAALPINLKQQHTPNTPKQNAIVSVKIRTALFLLTFFIFQLDHKALLHPVLILLLYCYDLYCLVELLVSLASIPIRTLFNIDLDPQSDEPYLATSLQDFWSRRWNLAVPAILRPTIYEPVRRYVHVHLFLGQRTAKLAAVVSAFGVSGLMHELISYVVTRAAPTWEMTCFFVLHGFCLAAEREVKRAVGGRVKKRVTAWVSAPLTLGFVALTAQWLFFPPMVRNGADERMVDEWRSCLNFLLNFLA